MEKIAELWREARYGGRLLKKNPGFTIIVGITLALGIGATTAIFSVLYATALAPLPFADPNRLVFIQLTTPQGRSRAVPVDAVDAWRKNAKTLDTISGLLGGVNVTVSGPNGAQRILLEQVDFHTLEVLGVRPLLGRWFQPDEVIVQGNVAQTIVISYGLWQRVFGGAPDVIGKKMPGWTAGWGETVIGVMPKGFYTEPRRSDIDAWYLITRNPGPAIARLKAGVLPEQAQAELTGLGWQDPSPNNVRQNQTWALQITPLQEFYRRDYVRTVYMLLGAVAFVLLIVISESLAREYFGDENRIGKSIHADMNSLNRQLEGDRVRQIVGVVGDIRMEFKAPPMPIMYVPYRQNMKDYQSNGFLGIHAVHGFALRTSDNPLKLVDGVRRIFADVDGSVALTDIAPMRTRLSQLAGVQEFWMRLLGIFAGLGMFLAAIGVYGVISYSVEQRTHEFSIRTTLGARDADIIRLVLREGFWVILVGLVCSLGGAYGATRLLIHQLYGVTPMDPLTLVAVAVVLTIVALLACYIPGRRATKRDPLSALRVG